MEGEVREGLREGAELGRGYGGEVREGLRRGRS